MEAKNLPASRQNTNDELIAISELTAMYELIN